MFWIGLALGFVIGGMVGAGTIAMMNAAKTADRATDEWYRDYGNHRTHGRFDDDDHQGRTS
jgi:hypothetical protein